MLRARVQFIPRYTVTLSLGFKENTKSLDIGFVEMLPLLNGCSAVSFPDLMFTASTNTNLITLNITKCLVNLYFILYNEIGL